LKEKPKLPAQFKAAETNGIPFAVVFGEDEMVQGKVKIKEMGLPEGHPEKEGVLVDLKNLVPEIEDRLKRKQQLDSLAQKAKGLQVMDGIKHKDDVKDEVPVTEKPAEESAFSQEAIGAVPAS